jgi:hypothetical protein
VSVLNLATAFDDDVGVRLEQADQLLTGRHDLAVKHAALGLDNNAGYQVAGNARPRHASAWFPSRPLGQPCGHRLQFVSAGLGRIR